MEHLFYYMPPTPSEIWEDKGKQKTVNSSQNKRLFCKN